MEKALQSFGQHLHPCFWFSRVFAILAIGMSATLVKFY